MTKTRNEIEQIVNDLGYELLDEFFEEGYRKVIIKNKNGYKAKVYLTSIVKHKTYFVDKHNPYTLENIKVWIELNNKTFELCEGNKYLGRYNPLSFHCFICDDIFYMSWSDLSKHGCAVCGGHQIGNKHSLGQLRPEFIQQWIKSEHNLTPYDVTEFSSEKVLWKCLKCKNTWIATVNHRSDLRFGTNCPFCAASKGEKEISKFLNLYSIEFIPQYKFKNCKHKSFLPFDFYLPDYNLICEFHGPQHFFPVDFAGRGLEWAEDQFKQIQVRDKIKENYCYDNNIPLLIISYTEFSNIEQILTDYLGL